MRHMVAAGYTRRIFKEARRETRVGPVGENLKPAVTELKYANPLGGAVDFDLSLKQAGRVRLEVYSVEGRKVATLLDRPMSAGSHSIQWDGKDARGQSVTAGVYFCRFETRDLTVTTKLVLSR
jgi:flagellar hook assembly protein FlgD